MSATDVDAIIAEYLHQLDSALHQIPASRRRQLVSEIEDHIREARSQLPDQSEASVLNLLDRVGRPEDIAAEAMADQPGHASRLPRRWLIAGLAAVVVVGVGVGLGLAFAGGTGRTTNTPPPATHLASISVPVVVGQTPANAATTLTSAGLKVEQTMTSSTAVPQGQVASQEPAAGTAVPPGTTVTIFVSSGPPTVTVPAVGGMTNANAGAELARLGLNVVVQRQTSSVLPAGTVISSEPSAGSAVPVGSTVTIITSLGPPTAST